VIWGRDDGLGRRTDALCARSRFLAALGMTISLWKLSKKGKGKRRSRFPMGMTERKAKTTT
jgi:hypothetical protein